jgi:hypothetical protein
VAQCDDCKFMWVVDVGPSGQDGQFFECRCHAPQLTGTRGGWPKVLATDWCGEYQPIAVEREEPDG